MPYTTMDAIGAPITLVMDGDMNIVAEVRGTNRRMEAERIARDRQTIDEAEVASYFVDLGENGGA